MNRVRHFFLMYSASLIALTPLAASGQSSSDEKEIYGAMQFRSGRGAIRLPVLYDALPPDMKKMGPFHHGSVRHTSGEPVDLWPGSTDSKGFKSIFPIENMAGKTVSVHGVLRIENNGIRIRFEQAPEYSADPNYALLLTFKIESVQFSPLHESNDFDKLTAKDKLCYMDKKFVSVSGTVSNTKTINVDSISELSPYSVKPHAPK